jgi:nucleoside-diphosphate-sugar epimerase
MTTNLVAVTGATGYVGRFFVTELQRQGISIRALSRPQSDRHGFAAPMEWVDGDLRDTEALRKLVTGADAVVHLAYEHVPGKYRGGEGDDLYTWLNANLNGSLQLLLDARNARVKRFLFLSSRAVFSRTEPGRELDETHPTSPDSHYGAYKAAVEAFMQSVSHTSDMQTCSIRATGVYGITYPVEHTKWWTLIKAVIQDEPLTSNGGGTEVHGADVARTIRALLTWPMIPFDVVHLSDLYVTHREVVQLAREIMGRPGELPPAPEKLPQNVMVSRHLNQLGIVLGGRSQLEATIREMVSLAQSANE